MYGWAGGFPVRSVHSLIHTECPERIGQLEDLTMKKIRYLFAITAFLAMTFTQPVFASSAETTLPEQTPNSTPNAPYQVAKGGDRPDALAGVTIEQKLNSQLPLDATFQDEYGQTVQLNRYFGKRPVVLALVYYECPMLCTQILNGMVRTAKLMKFTPGKDYDVLAISFDAREKPEQALAKKQVYMKDYGHPETANGWHFLTGSPDSIKRVTDAVGFQYKWDAATAAFAHASAIYILTPDGKLSKYFYGIDYSPKDMRFGLVEASHDMIGTAVDQILLFCYHFDPHTAKYTPLAMGILRVAGAATLLLLGGFVFIKLRRESSQRSRAA
jgi:protein SCO1